MNYHQQFLEVNSRFVFEVNNERTRQNIIFEYYRLFDKKFLGRFVDYTTPEQTNYGIVDIRVEIGGHVFTIEEYCDFMERNENFI